ncbi:MAG: UDP-N-acetylmuramoyl-tripeptide--D-alanyl-D-alanine ligase [Clostridiales bacterium]|nr:UDP-N-acetylmuramoyl-tripeptide--D-alanyl-D-alanine ligase [Clostridiales bacterium]
MNLSLKEIASALGSISDSEKRIKRISIDSRDVDETTLFFAIKGERFDAHDFIPDIQDKVGAVVISKDIECSCPSVKVSDTKDAFLKLANYYRNTFKNLILIGLTGSVGKTTSKEMTACVMAQKYKTLKTEGNFNNEIGMPKTLFRLDDSYECAVIEMGMSEFGEISLLSRTAQPDAAIITNIGVSHIENLGSRDGIFKAKMEMTEGLKNDGILIVNGDDDKLSTIKGEGFRVIYYGIENRDCQMRAEDIVQDGLETIFTAVYEGQEERIKIPAVGIHNVYNAIAALCMGMQYGISLKEGAQGLAGYMPSGMRQNIQQKAGITFIEDCYNAAVDSQKAGLNTLCSIAKGRKIAVLGDMLEMGAYSEEGHREVGRYAAEKNVDMLLTFGPESHFMADSARRAGLVDVIEFEDRDRLAEALCELLREDDTVLFKASHGMHLEEVIYAIYDRLN